MTNDKSIFIKNIYYMLSYTFNILKQEDYKKVAAEDFERVQDLFAAILSKGISRQLKQGFYREYVPKHESLYVMQGKLDIHGTIQQKIQRSQQLICKYDELTENNIYNQILKTTMHCLIHSNEVSTEHKTILKKLNIYFGNVDLLLIHQIKWEKLIYQRNNRNYELLLNVCYLTLKGLLQTTEDGVYNLVSFSDEYMERLYEKFVLEYYKQHYAELKPKATQIKWNLTETPDNTMIHFLPTMQTDITLQKDNKTLIIDTKYYGKSMIYNYDKLTLRSAHLYQIFAYVKNFDQKNTGNVSGLLLYAKTEKDSVPDCMFNICGNKIGAKSLDLNQEFTIIVKQLDNIINQYF